LQRDAFVPLLAHHTCVGDAGERLAQGTAVTFVAAAGAAGVAGKIEECRRGRLEQVCCRGRRLREGAVGRVPEDDVRVTEYGFDGQWLEGATGPVASRGLLTQVDDRGMALRQRQLRVSRQGWAAWSARYTDARRCRRAIAARRQHDGNDGRHPDERQQNRKQIRPPHAWNIANRRGTRAERYA
jgi:hypothetical protein